jgi:hypothetical protein
MNDGSLGYLLTSVSPEHERLLSGISELTGRLLWICPGVDWDDLHQRFKLDEAFPGLRGITWQRDHRYHASELGPRENFIPPDLRKYWTDDVEKLATVENALVAEDGFSMSRIAWAPSNWSEQWHWITSQCCEVSFVPDTQEAAARWTRVALGLTWLKDLSPHREPNLPSEPDAVMRSYIRTTMHMSGIATLRWRADTYSGLLCFGNEDQLQYAASKLESQGADVATNLGFNRLWTRGLYLEAEMG